MLSAYSVHQLLKLPLTIECLASYRDHLLIGTKQGHLLMYAVRTNGGTHVSASEDDEAAAVGTASSSSSVDDLLASPPVISEPKSDEIPRVQLLRTNKFFSKKPITHLQAVNEYAILIALCDSVITVHDMDMAVTNFPCIFTVQRAKGASTFALDIVRQKSLTGETSAVVRMVVAVRRKLQFYYWKNRRFHDLYPDVTVQDIPRSLAWCKDSICIGFRGEYLLIKMSGEQEMCELFPTGKNQEASVTLLSDDRFALGKDEQTTFIDLQGTMKLYSVSWSESPQVLAHDFPYLLAVLSKMVEVRTEDPRLHLQTIELPGPKFVSTCSQGLVYVASHSHIWLLQMVPASIQIPQLLREKQFELAITLSNLGDDPLDNKTKRIQRIQTLYAFDLFCNQKFKDSMDVFYKLDIDTSHVIGLFQDLLPLEFRNQLSYPSTPPVLQGHELENAILALIEYLTQRRHQLFGNSSKAIDPVPIMEKCTTIKSKKHMLQVLDTTLLKCYLKTNDALVAPLLRLKENNCHLEETERALKRSQKFSELVIFYNTRGYHQKALSLLKEYHDKPQSSLKGHLRTVQYLQNLGPEYIDIIFEFATWVLDVDENDGLSIFTEDMMEVETLPRAKVLEFLARTKKSAVIPYLKYVIVQWKETNSVFHNALVLRYKDHIAELIQFGEAETKIAKLREELREFLLSSTHYTAESVLPQFPSDFFQEERALLLATLKRHREALILYLFHLKDVSCATKYCRDHYQPGSDIFDLLVKLLLDPPDDATLKELGISTSVRPPIDVSSTYQILKMHGDKVNIKTAIDYLPDDTPLHLVEEFLSARMGERVSKANQLSVQRGLQHAEHLQVQEERIALESRKVMIGELDVCRVCHKRFNNQGAFARLPSGEILHLSCLDKA